MDHTKEKVKGKQNFDVLIKACLLSLHYIATKHNSLLPKMLLFVDIYFNLYPHSKTFWTSNSNYNDMNSNFVYFFFPNKIHNLIAKGYK